MSNVSSKPASLTQSPVNISTGDTPTKSLNQVLELNYYNDTITIINNGSNIDADFESKDNFVVHQKDKYFLEGIHLHTKSEHTFDGKNTDGEIHLVHKTTSGEILVVGMLLEAVNNGALVNTQVDSFLQRIDSSLKDTSKTIEDLSFDPSQLISNTTEVYNFGGSLTTTPFSDATWIVSSEILKVNQDGLQKFSKLQDEFYGNNGINNRDPQNELYLGTDGKDKIFGDRNGASADIIYGNDGNDFLKGFEADDKIFGNEGDDTLKGGFGDDLLLDNEGNDYLEGNEGNDTLKSGFGSDYLKGGDGNDIMDGGSGDDYIIGNSGNDIIVAGSGSDTLIGGKGSDTVDGGNGSDRYIFETLKDSSRNQSDRIKGYDDSDVFDVSSLDFNKIIFDPTGKTGTANSSELRFFQRTTGGGEERTYVVNDQTQFSFYLVGTFNLDTENFNFDSNN